MCQKHFCISILIGIVLSSVTGQMAYSREIMMDGDRQKWGFDIGYGTQSGLDVTYFYEVYFCQYQYYFTLLARENWALEALAQPQFNLSSFKDSEDSPQRSGGYEYGLNAGLLIRGKIINNRINPYVFISTGPHAISGAPDRQAPGFIFSDNFFSGTSIRLNENLSLDLRYGFRHISNAGLKDPNGGINTFVVSMGIVVHSF